MGGEIQRLLEEQCAYNEACKIKVEELKKNADDTILKLVKEQSAKDEANKEKMESLAKKNKEMLELLTSINNKNSSSVKVECLKKEEPKDQQVNEEPQKKRVKVFHYTTTMGLEGITKEGVVRKSANGFSGEGVYLTSLDPDHFTREQVAQNIYGSPTWQERLAAGNLDCWLEVQVEESRLSRCSIDREVFILLEDLQLEKPWRAGQTTQTPETEYIKLKVEDQDGKEIQFRVKQTTQMD